MSSVSWSVWFESAAPWLGGITVVVLNWRSKPFHFLATACAIVIKQRNITTGSDAVIALRWEGRKANVALVMHYWLKTRQGRRGHLGTVTVRCPHLNRVFVVMCWTRRASTSDLLHLRRLGTGLRQHVRLHRPVELVLSHHLRPHGCQQPHEVVYTVNITASVIF